MNLQTSRWFITSYISDNKPGKADHKKAPIFVDTKMDDPVQIALLELLQKKIKLSDGNVPPQISESKKAEKSL